MVAVAKVPKIVITTVFPRLYYACHFLVGDVQCTLCYFHFKYTYVINKDEVKIASVVVMMQQVINRCLPVVESIHYLPSYTQRIYLVDYFDITQVVVTDGIYNACKRHFFNCRRSRSTTTGIATDLLRVDARAAVRSKE